MTKAQRKFDPRPLEKRGLCYTNNECALVAGVTRQCWQIYRKKYPRRPEPPTSKTAILNYMRHYKLPPRPMGRPNTTQMKVVELHNQGLAFCAIDRILGIATNNSHRAWTRYQNRMAKEKLRGY